MRQNAPVIKFTRAQIRSCPLCGSSKALPLVTAVDTDGSLGRDFTVVTCQDCPLSYLVDIPDKSLSEALYFERYYGRSMRGLSAVVRGCQWLFLSSRGREIERWKRGSSLLDVGCGDGAFMSFMKGRGWKVAGVEASRAGMGKASELGLGSEIFYGELRELCLERPFDVVTFWHSLEHMEDPLEALKAAVGHLGEDGIMLVAVPNIQSLQAHLAGDKWFHLDVPRHIIHFSPRSLTLLLEKVGLEVVDISHWSWEYGPFGWFQTLMNLASCEFNFLYNVLKRGRSPRRKSLYRRAYTITFSPVFSLPFALLSVVLAVLEASLGRAGAIMVIARKRCHARQPASH